MPQLLEPVALGNVEDVESFVRSALAAALRSFSAATLPPDRTEKAVADLIGVCFELYRRYDVKRGKKTFSSYAFPLLKLRVVDVVYRAEGDTRSGERPQVVSLDGGPLQGDLGDGAGGEAGLHETLAASGGDPLADSRAALFGGLLESADRDVAREADALRKPLSRAAARRAQGARRRGGVVKRPARVPAMKAAPGSSPKAPACATCTRREQKKLMKDSALNYAEAREKAILAARMVRVGDGWLCSSCTMVPTKPDGITEISLPLELVLPNRAARRSAMPKTPPQKRRQIVAKAELAEQQAEAEMRKPRSRIKIAKSVIEIPKIRQRNDDGTVTDYEGIEVG